VMDPEVVAWVETIMVPYGRLSSATTLRASRCLGSPGVVMM
jgi:hypothetical protein